MVFIFIYNGIIMSSACCRIWHNVLSLRAIFVSDIEYTSCNFDLIHDCLCVISISSNRHVLRV